MLIDDIKKANIQAMKAHDQNARSAYSMVISRYQTLLTSGADVKVSDADVVHIIQKFAKELDEEKDGYVKFGREESAKAVEAQKDAISAFLPKQMGEAEVRAIIAGLADKSIPSVMKYFKANHDGQVDMGLVSKIARGL